MDKMNKSHLIAGFFRYHREKLNYSLRGLVGDGSVVELSSLSDFEHGKRNLSEEQLVYLFQLIGYDYKTVIDSYDFKKEYNQIIEHIYLGETGLAEAKYKDCYKRKVYDSLGVSYFLIIQYYFSVLFGYLNDNTEIVFKIYDLFTNNQRAFIKIIHASEMKLSGYFFDSIQILQEAEKMTFNPKIRAWIYQLFGFLYCKIGNYAEATVALLEAKNRFGDFLGIIRMIQVNLNLGTVYSLTHSYEKAEESYMIAYERCLMLKESTGLLTKCFNSLCWLYFETNEYDKVKDLLENKPEELVESRNTYYILAWANYKLGNTEEAIKYCEAGLEKFKEYSYVSMIYEYIKKASKGIKTGQDALLKKIIETEDYDHDKLTERLFTLELIDIYERRKNYEKAFKYAKKLLNR